MWTQPIEPITPAGFSVLASAIPLGVLLMLMAFFRTSALKASSCALLTAGILAVFVWKMPLPMVLWTVLYGCAYATSPILWIVFSALVLYHIAVETGSFEQLRCWIRDHASADPSIQAIFVAFCFGALLESCAGFGAPVAVTAFLLAALGFDSKLAVIASLIANTAPVGFGGMGLPILALSGVTGLDSLKLSAMVGRQLPFISLLLPLYLVWLVGGSRSIRRTWPVALTAGASYAIVQALVSNLWGPYATDILAAGTSIVATLVVLAFRPRKPEHGGRELTRQPESVVTEDVPFCVITPVSTWIAWLPWIILSAVMVLWSVLDLFTFHQFKLAVPRLDQKVFISLYGRPYSAVYVFQALSVGTGVAFAATLSALALRMPPKRFGIAILRASRQMTWTSLTILSIVSLAYLYNYSGMIFTLAAAATYVGSGFPLVSGYLGWLGCFITGSDAASNLLFGNLQVAAARQLNFDPVLLSATNSSGGVFGKIISPQNIAVGVTTVGLIGHEGMVLRSALWHSIILVTLLSCVAYSQAYWVKWMVP